MRKSSGSPTRYPEWVKTEAERRAHDDFRVFLWMIWKHLDLPPPTEIQNDIAKYIATGPRRLIVQAFRGVGKSWITAAYVLWVLYRDPQLKIMVVSASKERADSFSIFCKRLISDVPFLKFLEPGPGQRDSNIAFDVRPAKPDQSPSVKSVGITGQITGSRADLIIPDDVETPTNCVTEAQREKLATLVTEFDAVLKPGGQVRYLGTPQTEASLYTTLQNKGYSCRVWTSEYTDGLDDQGIDKYHGTLSPIVKPNGVDKIAGKTVEPTRFTDEDLDERRLSYGRSGYALQFMLDTSLNDAHRYPLKVRDLIVMDLDKSIAPVQLTWASGPSQVIDEIPNVGLTGDRAHRPMYASDAHVEYQGSVMFIDPSGRGADECAYAIVKMLNGMVYVTAWGGIKGNGYDETTLNALALLAKEHKVNEVWSESNFGDGMFNALFAPVLKRHHPCTLDEYRVTGQKEARIIDKLEPIMNQHRLVLDTACALSNATVDTSGSAVNCGLYQLTHLTRERGALKHDDRADVLAEAVGYWVERLDMDTTQGEDRWKEQEKERRLKEFASQFGKKHHGNRNWASGNPGRARRVL